jgi:hypothetical protein
MCLLHEFEWTENGPRKGLFLEEIYLQPRLADTAAGRHVGRNLKTGCRFVSPIIRRNGQMKLASVVLASALALSCNVAQGQSASSTAGGSSKAGGPSATSGTTGASKSGSTTGGMSGRHRHHKKHPELSGIVLAQAGAPSGRGATTGDPAASSATPGTSPTTGSSMKPNPSGSGTSTSGGKDGNGDQGRDKMPDSSQDVRPNNKPDKM